jgi:hypothetical protein
MLTPVQNEGREVWSVIAVAMAHEGWQDNGVSDGSLLASNMNYSPSESSLLPAVTLSMPAKRSPCCLLLVLCPPRSREFPTAGVPCWWSHVPRRPERCAVLHCLQFGTLALPILSVRNASSPPQHVLMDPSCLYHVWTGLYHMSCACPSCAATSP